jgi:hypothetical protein
VLEPIKQPAETAVLPTPKVSAVNSNAANVSAAASPQTGADKDLTYGIRASESCLKLMRTRAEEIVSATLDKEVDPGSKESLYIIGRAHHLYALSQELSADAKKWTDTPGGKEFAAQTEKLTKLSTDLYIGCRHLTGLVDPAVEAKTNLPMLKTPEIMSSGQILRSELNQAMRDHSIWEGANRQTQSSTPERIEEALRQAVIPSVRTGQNPQTVDQALTNSNVKVDGLKDIALCMRASDTSLLLMRTQADAIVDATLNDKLAPGSLKAVDVHGQSLQLKKLSDDLVDYSKNWKAKPAGKEFAEKAEELQKFATDLFIGCRHLSGKIDPEIEAKSNVPRLTADEIMRRGQVLRHDINAAIRWHTYWTHENR